MFYLTNHKSSWSHWQNNGNIKYSGMGAEGTVISADRYGINKWQIQ